MAVNENIYHTDAQTVYENVPQTALRTCNHMPSFNNNASWKWWSKWETWKMLLKETAPLAEGKEKKNHW